MPKAREADTRLDFEGVVIYPQHAPHVVSVRSSAKGPTSGKNAAKLPSDGFGARAVLACGSLVGAILMTMLPLDEEQRETASVRIQTVDHMAAPRDALMTHARARFCSSCTRERHIPYQEEEVVAEPKTKAREVAREEDLAAVGIHVRKMAPRVSKRPSPSSGHPGTEDGAKGPKR